MWEDLKKAIQKNNTTEVEKLITQLNYKELHKVDNKGYTALHHAAINGHEKACELLIKASPRLVENVDNEGYIALDHAAINGHEKVCDLLIKEHPELIDDEENSYTVLHHAAINGHEKVCDLLIKANNLLVEIVDNKGYTALHHAAINGHEKVCKLLIKVSSRLIEIVDNKGYTALDHAAINGHEKACELLITEYPELIYEIEENSYTALHHAAINGHEKVCKLLIKANHLLIEAIDKEGYTALDHAAYYHRNSKVFEALHNAVHYGSEKESDKKIIIPKESTQHARELLEISYTTLKKLVDTFYSAVEQTNKCITNNPENIFIKSYDIIKSCLPLKVEYSDLNRLPKHATNEYFLNLEQIKAFQKLFNTLSNNQNSTGKDIFLKALEIFEEFAKDDKLKQQIQEYAHIFKQQIEHNKFLSQVCDNKPVDHNYIEQAVQKCKAYINTALEKEIKSIKLEDGKLDIAYYKKAIEYLDQHKDNSNCIKIKADAYNNIGRIYDNQGNYSQAALNYTKALELNTELPKIYDRLGEILFNNKQYSEAIKCFKVVDKSIKIENCFKELVKLNPDEPNIRIDKGNYYFSVGRYDKAIGCYKDAFSLSEDDNFKLATNKKIVNSLEKQAEKTSELIRLINNQEIYHYNEINTNELYQAITKIVSNYNYEVINMGNTSDLYG